jgi:hypothetical protein
MLSVFSVKAQEKTSPFSIPLKTWNLQLVSLRNLYPTCMADPLTIRNEVSSQRILFSDIDFFDEVNENGSYKGKLTIYAGGRVSLLKLSPESNPELGIEIDIGVTIPVIMRQGNHDLIGVDGIYYFAIAGRPTEWLSLRFSKHHICTHVGDEFPTGSVASPIDFDPNIMQLPVRDDFILSAAVKPLWFTGNPRLNFLQIYGDFGGFWPGVDFMGTRQNKPHKHGWLNLQAGAEIEYYFKNEYFGGVFTAFNVSAYQTNSFAPNLSFMAGYIPPQQRNKRKVRLALHYYNGRSLSNQFYNRKEKFLAFSVAFDI